MVKEKSENGVVVWVIDPFEGKLKPHPIEVRNLLRWAHGTSAQIRPVYILNLSVSNQGTEEQNNMTIHKTATAEAATKNYLNDIGFLETLTPKVLVTYDTPVGGMIERLVQYCDDVNAKMIVVSSRGRKGFDRFVFGSFAETLLFQSKLPLYFLTHQNGTPTVERGNKILFPTDFSEHSKLALEFLLPEAKISQSEIILYYAMSLPASVVLVPDNYYIDQEEEAKKEAQKWIEKAGATAVKIIFITQNVGFTSSVAPSIINVAKEKSVRFIAMASNSGKVGSIFFGSVAREVSRTNLFPVWICGPRTLKK